MAISDGQRLGNALCDAWRLAGPAEFSRTDYFDDCAVVTTRQRVPLTKPAVPQAPASSEEPK